MGTPLPPWVVANADSIRREAEPYLALTPEERASLMTAACRAAAKLARSRPDFEKLLAWRDPLPDSSVRLLAKLRAEYRTRSRG